MSPVYSKAQSPTKGEPADYAYVKTPGEKAELAGGDLAPTHNMAETTVEGLGLMEAQAPDGRTGKQPQES